MALTMIPDPSLSELTAEQWRRLQEILDQFEAVSKKLRHKASAIDLGPFVPPPNDPLRLPALVELVKTDLEIRWRTSPAQRLRLEDYIVRFPELGTFTTVPVSLILQEYLVRREYGDRPSLDVYRVRFPNQFVELQKHLQRQAPESPAAETIDLASASAGAAPPAATASSNVLAAPGGYRLIERIGAGGIGEVWRSEAPGGVEVALKIIYRPLDHKESRRELRALELIRRMRHPFLLPVQAYWTLEDQILIVMELADGSLRDRLHECRKAGKPGISRVELLRYIHESAEALDYLHRQEVLHRDIKPDNILILQLHAKVADFDLARLRPGPTSTMASGRGTLAYMAPETWKGDVRAESDQFSLAVTYAEMRLGHRVFPSRSLMSILEGRAEEPPDLTPLPEAEQSVLRKALSPQPEDRFSSCGVFANELSRLGTLE